MLKKLVAVLIATLFSLSVMGPSLAAEEKKPATPATPAKKEAAANPCEGAGKGEMKAKKKAQKPADKKAECLKKATTDEAKAECEKKFAEKGKKKTAKKKTGEVPGPMEK
ncbi:MAG: hypothetical protein ACRD1B_05710 [Thermoanaerobaculia bacterium]